MVTLTHHKKSVRALAIHPTEYTFASASAGGNNIKKWKCPEGMFVFNFSGHNAIINTLSVNSEGVFFSGGDNGTLTLWDWNTGTAFQNMDDIPQPGSLEAEAGVFCSTFDMTGTRLITGGADKTIKVRPLIHTCYTASDPCFRSMRSSHSDMLSRCILYHLRTRYIMYHALRPTYRCLPSHILVCQVPHETQLWSYSGSECEVRASYGCP